MVFKMLYVVAINYKINFLSAEGYVYYAKSELNLQNHFDFIVTKSC